jgi:hypothetical protein
VRALVILLLLARCAVAERESFPGEEIWGVGRADGKRLNIIIVPDGWTESDLRRREPSQHTVPRYTNSSSTTVTSYPPWPEICRRLRDSFLAREPFKTYRNMLRITRIDVASPNSGVSRQSTRANVDTYFDTEYFDLFGKPDRALRFKDDAAAMNLLRRVKWENKPAERHVAVVLVNDPGVIGTGTAFGMSESSLAGFIQTASHPRANATFAHEMGHALARLGDEYFEDGLTGEEAARYDTWTRDEPDYRNLTKNNTAFPKWSHWRNVEGIGAFPGGILHRRGIFHPTTQGEGKQANCGMAESELEFCVVCRERIVQRLYETVSLIDSYEPAQSVHSASSGWQNKITQPGQRIRVTTVGPVSRDSGGNLTSSLEATWLLDGNKVNGERQVLEAGPVFTYTLPTTESRAELVLLLKDKTSWVRATPGTQQEGDRAGNTPDPLSRDTSFSPGGRRDHAYVAPVRLVWKLNIRPDAAGLPGLQQTAGTR